MTRSAAVSFLRLSLVFFFVSMGFTAFTAPQTDDLVEIRQWMNGRNQASFRAADNNKVTILKPGTKAEVVDTKYFPGTKNYGVCLKTLDSTPGDRCVWAYYNTKDPNMNLYAVHGDADVRKNLIRRWMKTSKGKVAEKVSSPEDAQAAQTTRQVSAMPEREPSSTPQTTAGAESLNNSGADGKGLDVNSLLKGTMNAISSINSDIQKVLNPSPVCKECATKLLTYETCNSSNNYLESALANLQNNPIMSQVLSADISSDKSAIRPECFQKSMETFNASGAFRQCRGDNDARNAPHLKKACTSENYVNTTAKSFNAVSDCLAGYVADSSDPEIKRVTALSIFTMINVESGFHVNALSPTGAGGPGQFTQPAIDTVNQNMQDLKEYLAKSDNPLCNNTLAKVLNHPMDGRPSKSCERINLSDNNPLRNMMYIFAYQASLRRGLNGLFDNPAYQDVISSLSPKLREAFLSGLMTWSHNTGPAGMETPLRHLLRASVQQKVHLSSKEDVASFMTTLAKDMRLYPHSANSSSARRRETSIYYPSISSRMMTIGRQISGGVRGCFINPNL